MDLIARDQRDIAMEVETACDVNHNCVIEGAEPMTSSHVCRIVAINHVTKEASLSRDVCH